MKIEILETHSGITRLVLSGRMDVQAAVTADMTFSIIAGAKKRVIVDLSDVTFMASLGLRTLMVSAKSIANKGGKMVLLNPRPDVEEVLQTAGVSAAIPVVRDMHCASALLGELTTEPNEYAMCRFIQNVSDASASSSSPARRSAVALSVVDYGLLAMLLVTLVSFGSTLAGN